ncbi:MAG TPA: phenylacetate--CoA ligase family protein [Blastocatellia bacterium]|nr:phenylacetate--CoA ligase family protein [Blastocatellia bacterium]
MSFRSAAKRVLGPFYYRLPPSIRYGSQFTSTLRLLEESQRWDEGRLIEYQLSKLRRMLKHCAANVPYYRSMFGRLGFDPENVKELSDLRALPLLDKETVRANVKDLLAENIPARRRFYCTTGGTSGTPLGVFHLRGSGGRELAFILTQWARVGFRYGHRRAILRGWPVRSRRHWRYDVKERAFVFSNFHMTPDNVAEYARVMSENRLAALHSYPSAVVDFARHLKELGIEPPRFASVLASSENLYPGQREFIESFFGARLFSWYGHTENLILAGECEVSNDYHIFPEYGVAEVVREDGSAADGEDEIGEFVGTTLDNLAMPLLRYRTGDYARIGSRGCACGRSYRLIKETRGRWQQEMLVGKLNNLISVTALNIHTDVFDRAQQIQFYQRERGKLELRIKRKSDYTERDSRRILAALEEKIGDTMDVTLSFPEEIPLSPRGKFRLVIQELEIPRVSFDEMRL